MRAALGQRLASGAAWAFIANGLGQLLPFAATLALARVLSVPEYGRFVFLYTTASMLASLTGFSLGLTATRFVAAHHRDAPHRAGQVITGSIRAVALEVAAIGGLALVVSPFLSRVLPGEGDSAGAILAVLALFTALALSGVQAGILAGLHRFREIASGNLVRLTIGLALAVSFGQTGSSSACLAGIALGGAVGLAVNHRHLLAAAREHAIPLNWFHSAPLPWKTFAIPALLAYLVVAPILWVGQVLLLRAPGAAVEVAIFNISLQWRNLVVMIPSAVSQAATPWMAQLYEAGERTVRAVRINVVASTVPAALVAAVVLFAAPIITAAYGGPYSSAATVIRIGALTGILMAFNNALGASITATGKMWAGFAFNALWAVAVLILAVPLTRSSGAFGLSLAVAFAYLLHACWQGAYILRREPVREPKPCLS